MKFRPLGNTGLKLSEIGFGAWAIGGPVDLFGIPVGWDGVDDRESKATISRAYELGVNFFDTADVYGSGHSEILIGDCLEGKDCIIATKVGNARTSERAYKDFSEKHIRQAIEGSLKRLKRDIIDIYQLHNPPPAVWQGNEVFDLLNRLKTEGRIRFSGVSISTMEEGIHLVENRKVDCLQVLFNVFNQEPAKRLLPLAEKAGVGVIVRVPLASGLLTGKFNPDHQFSKGDNRSNYLSRGRLHEAVQKTEKLKGWIRESGYTMTQVSLAFLLKFSSVTSPIPGAKNVTQVEQNVSSSDVTLDDALFDKIREEFSEYNFFLRYGVKI